MLLSAQSSIEYYIRFVHLFIRTVLNMKKQQIVVIGVLLIGLLIAGVVIMQIANSRNGENVGIMPTPQVSESPVAFTDTNAIILEVALNSTDKSRQANALVPELRDGEWEESGLLPDGATLTISNDTFVVDEQGFGRVDAKISGSVEAEFIIHMMVIDGQWLIYTTEQKR